MPPPVIADNSLVGIRRRSVPRSGPLHALGPSLLGPTVGRAGGERGIRTPGTLAGTPDFESGTFNRSVISPPRVVPWGTARCQRRFSVPARLRRIRGGVVRAPTGAFPCARAAVESQARVARRSLLRRRNDDP